MLQKLGMPLRTKVAPHAGSVDWNNELLTQTAFRFSRSPCGERGLESDEGVLPGLIFEVAPHAGSVDWNFATRMVRDYVLVAPHAGSVDWNNAA